MMKISPWSVPVLLALLLLPIGCVRPCYNALNNYAVGHHEFRDIEQVILGEDRSVAFAGTYLSYRWGRDYEKKEMVKVITQKHTVYVVGSAENMRTFVREELFAQQQRQSKEDSNSIKIRGIGMFTGRHSNAHSVPHSKEVVRFNYEPWQWIHDKNNHHPPDPALLPASLRNGVNYTVGSEPMAYMLDGKTVHLDFRGATDEMATIKLWGLAAGPFTEVTDVGLSIALLGWGAILLPVDGVCDHLLKIPVAKFLWPVPFYNTWRKSKGLEPVKPGDIEEY